MDVNGWNALFGLMQLVVTALAFVVWRQHVDLKRTAETTARELADHKTSAARELADYKTHVAETYVTNNELSKAVDSLNRAIDAVFKKLERIDEKLDRKADK